MDLGIISRITDAHSPEPSRSLVVRQADPAPISPNFGAIEQMFFATPFTGWSHLLSGVTHPYRQHVWVYACVNAIAQNIAGVPFSFYTGNKKNKRLVETSPLVKLFETPNPTMSGYQLMEATLVFLGISGECIYIQERPNITAVPKEIWTFHPSRFTHVPGANGMIQGWVYRNGSKEIPFEPHEIVHFRRFNPYDDYRGLSPLEVAKLSLEQDYYAAKYNRNFFVNGAQPGGVLESKENLMQEEFDRLLAQWNDKHQGVDKSHQIALLEGGITYKQTGISQSDMLFLEGRKLNRDEILGGIYKVPKGELGIEDDTGSYAKDKVRRKHFWETTLDPLMVLIETVIWSRLCRGIVGPEVWPEFDRKSIPALQEDRDLLLGQAGKLWGMGVPLNVVNEYLDMGLPEIEGGDTGYLPFTLTPIGEVGALPAPTASVPVPAKSAPLGLPAPATRNAKTYKPGPTQVNIINKTGTEARGSAQQNDDGSLDVSLEKKVVGYWLNFNKLRTAMEEKFHSKIKRYFFEQRKVQLQLLADKLGGKSAQKDFADDLLFDLPTANEKLQKLSWGLWLNVGQEAGQAIYSELGLDISEFVIQDSAAIEELKTRLTKVVEINDWTREKLREAISEGLSKVESVAEIQERVREVFNLFDKPANGSFSRSLTIARTETGQAMGAARDAAMDQLGVEKIAWGTAGDGEVRNTHVVNAAIGPIKRGETFPNGCRYPCDPAGAAEEVINCRCVGIPVLEN